MSRVRPGLSLLFLLVAATGTAQGLTQPGTTMVIDEGTSLRWDAPASWSIQAGASVENNGVIVFGPEATLDEAAGAPITGAGTERTTRTYATPLAAMDPAGLGLRITTDAALGTTSIERGHTAWTDISGAVSIERWVRAAPANNSGLGATIAFRYDPTELNGVNEPDQVVHIATSGNTTWTSLLGPVDLDTRTVTASGLDSLGLFTTFEGALTTDMAARNDPSTRAFLAPNIATDRIVLYPADGASIDRWEIVDLNGRRHLRSDRPIPASSGGTAIAIHGLAAGQYFLRLDDGTTLPFVRP